MMEDTILEVENLRTSFATDAGSVQSVRGITFHVGKGESLGIVGESGCGKSVTMLSIMGLLEDNASRQADALLFDGEDLLKKSPREMRKIQGNRIGMIFQDPMTSLNPLFTVGEQIRGPLMRHQKLSRKEAEKKALVMLEAVGLPSPERRLKQYPHELSGGMRQRVLIAMALACGPKLLIADEPTTALDVTIQAQILDLLQELEEQYHTSIVLITHDMGVVATVCQRIAIMYGGLIMETGTADEIFYDPKHPYTRALLRAIPSTELKEGERLQAIEGLPPSLINPPAGCPFAERCEYAEEKCRRELPAYHTFSQTHQAMCHMCAPEKTEGGN